jgi:hypothetical protein
MRLLSGFYSGRSLFVAGDKPLCIMQITGKCKSSKRRNKKIRPVYRFYSGVMKNSILMTKLAGDQRLSAQISGEFYFSEAVDSPGHGL